MRQYLPADISWFLVLLEYSSTYPSSEELKPREVRLSLSWGGRRVHGLRQHQERARHQEQEEVKEEEGLEEQEVRKDAGAKTPAHCLERHLPQLEGVQEGQPAVPAVPHSLEEGGVEIRDASM